MRAAPALALAFALGCAHEPVAVAPKGPAPRQEPPSPAAPQALKGSGPALASQAESRFRSEDYAGAIELLKRAINATPALAALDPGRRLGRLERLFDEIELRSDDRRALFSREAGPAGLAASDAIVAYVEGRDVEAVLLASAAVGEDPQTQSIRLLLAAISKGTGLDALHEQLLPRAALVQHKLQRAEKAFFDKRFGEAARECQEAVWLDPRSAPAWTRLGSARWASGEPEKAREAYERALAIDPKNAEVRLFLESKGLLGRGRPAARQEIKSQ